MSAKDIEDLKYNQILNEFERLHELLRKLSVLSEVMVSEKTKSEKFSTLFNELFESTLEDFKRSKEDLDKKRSLYDTKEISESEYSKAINVFENNSELLRTVSILSEVLADETKSETFSDMFNTLFQTTLKDCKRSEAKLKKLQKSFV